MSGAAPVDAGRPLSRRLGDLFRDRVHRVPRRWSNDELRRFAPLFGGDVVNVSAWIDVDKEGGCYRDYFPRAESYTLTNYPGDDGFGFQGTEGEVPLDLEAPLPAELEGAFDVVFNHTTLEHVYDFRTAFENLTRMTRDALLLVVPWLQPYHTEYGDYWRFSPLAVKRMVEERAMELLYVSFNGHRAASVYVFAVASKRPERWRGRLPDRPFTVEEPRGSGKEPYAGCRAIPNLLYRTFNR